VKLIILTQDDGTQYLVNPHYIVFVEPFHLDESSTRIVLAGNLSDVIVHTSPMRVYNQINRQLEEA
jgi:hypothetical protein